MRTLSRPSTLDSATSAITSGYRGLINHFEDAQKAFGITVPDKANIQNCASEWTTKSNVILVDFWNFGPSVETADTLNGIVGTGKTSVTTSELTASSE